jgi:hypothetical protein
MRSSILARIPGFRQRIIPEPRVPSRGSQARGTRLWRRQSRNEEQQNSALMCPSLDKGEIRMREQNVVSGRRTR